MSSSVVVQRLVQRAKQAEEIIAQLKAQIENVKQAAGMTVLNSTERMDVSYPYICLGQIF